MLLASTRNPHDTLLLFTKAQFRRIEQAVDHIIVSAHAVVDQLRLAVRADDKERRRFPDRNTWWKGNDRFRFKISSAAPKTRKEKSPA
jgi:hypothetical protein